MDRYDWRAPDAFMLPAGTIAAGAGSVNTGRRPVSRADQSCAPGRRTDGGLTQPRPTGYRRGDEVMSMNYARVVLIGVLAFGLLIAPLAAGAQQARKIARVGFLGVGPPPSQEQIAQSPFVLAMRERGWVAGQNLVIERRYGESTDQLH